MRLSGRQSLPFRLYRFRHETRPKFSALCLPRQRLDHERMGCFASLLRKSRELTLERIRQLQTGGCHRFLLEVVIKYYHRYNLSNWAEAGNQTGQGLACLTKNPLLHRICIDPNVCFGKPTIRGTRLWVSLIPDQLASGVTADELIADYPQLTREDIRAAIA
jgi:uncharacterized protein (DUF433 family)